MKFTISQRILAGLSVALFVSLFSACEEKKEAETKPVHPKVAKLKLLPGFEAEHLYSPSENENGSWVAMTFDDKGRMITSDQYGWLYRLEIPAKESGDSLRIERLKVGDLKPALNDTSAFKIGMGYAQGLLYAFNSLYVMVNHWGNEEFEKTSGLYRLQDLDGDDQFESITLIKSLHGAGEHGPHSVVLAPDGKSIYVVAGNHTDVPEMDAYRYPKVWQEDNLFPLIKDPRGHANDRMAPGGWIAKINPEGTTWELVSAGYRNPYDIAFNEQGELFTYDSDMEWDFGMPWYRPTRICHVTSGSEYGWRTGNSKWSPDYPDNLPPVINIGQGSPTNLIHGKNSKFPAKYQKALFASDWSFGIIYAIFLSPEGASYSAEPQEFLSGVPLPLTDGIFGPDGSLYFLTGGRRLESDLYRVTYIGDESVAAPAVAAATEPAAIRKQLEAYHGAPQVGAVDFGWPYLSHEDRFVRYAARMAVEHQPVSEWQAKALAEKQPVALTQSMIALSRHGNNNQKDAALTALALVDYKALSEMQQIDLLRAMELVMLRMGAPTGGVKTQVAAYLNEAYPANSNKLNRGLSKLLVYLDDPKGTEKTLALLENAKDDPIEKTASASSDLILRNPQYGMDIASMLSKVPPAQQTYLATVLSEAKTGWTPDTQQKYFEWFNKAFGFKGGVSYVGFVNKARQAALTHVAKDKLAYYDKLSGGELLTNSGNDLANNAPAPKGPGRQWKVEEALALVEGDSSVRNFQQGKDMFAATRCVSCHAMQGEGGGIGPDLTQLGTRFSKKDMLEAIIDPNKVVSDQYASTVFTMKDGSSIVGRLTNETDEAYVIFQNPFAPESTRTIPKSDVVSTKYSYVSLMFPGLVNRLNEEELKDLLAYIMAGGNEGNEVFKAGE
ncbi:MAG: c-type cytochrome [Imperialibacter sp.]|uniref:c-type cytochrome n=1 Tax=Imperialibacter sp. TaxID=2038411 RepID=UPI0032EB0F13